MASHGVPRNSFKASRSEREREDELAKIKQYQGLASSVNKNDQEGIWTAAALNLVSELLTWNPEYYTAWNHRRRIIQKSLKGLLDQDTKHDETARCEQESRLIGQELSFLVPLLRQFPKCYWIWNYRLWLLELTNLRLPPPTTRRFWEQELGLAGKMLNLDSRNFHGWAYRASVVKVLRCIPASDGGSTMVSMTEQEFDYTTRMINSNLSNFSAWHYRSRLLPELATEKQITTAGRIKLLDQELDLIQRALWSSDTDSSLWFYHSLLMSTFDPSYAHLSIVPDMPDPIRLKYASEEKSKVEELLEDAEDCKWIYLALIKVTNLHKALSLEEPDDVRKLKIWQKELMKVDPIRKGRWQDMM